VSPSVVDIVDYSFGVDIRVDQFADNPQTSASDWAAQMGFVQNGFNYSFTPQVGIYASSLTQDGIPSAPRVGTARGFPRAPEETSGVLKTLLAPRRAASIRIRREIGAQRRARRSRGGGAPRH
jgi:hypothetical protein